MSFITRGIEALGSTSDLIPLAPSFYVLIVPAIAGAVALGPLQAICALGWLQVMQPQWQPGAPLQWLTLPPVLWTITTLAAVEFLVDKLPRAAARQMRLYLRMIPLLGAGLAMAAVRNHPIDVVIGAGIIAGVLATAIHCIVAPTRESVLRTGMAPFVTPIASTVQSLLCFSLLLPMSQRPILAGVLLLVVLLACSFILLLDRKPMGVWWRATFGLEQLPPLGAPENQTTLGTVGTDATLGTDNRADL
jgi:hypothetical protein